MNKIRKRHSSKFKSQVALAALKGNKTVAELCCKFGISASQISTWKKQLEDNSAQIFSDKRKKENIGENIDKLHRIIGELTADRDFLSRVLNRSR